MSFGGSLFGGPGHHLLGQLSFMGLQASAMVRKACRETEGRRKRRCFPGVHASKISICIDASRVSQGSTIVQTVRQAGSGVRLLRPERSGVQRGSCELGPCNCKHLPELRFQVRTNGAPDFFSLNSTFFSLSLFLKLN